MEIRLIKVANIATFFCKDLGKVTIIYRLFGILIISGDNMQDYLKELKNKFNYDDNMLKAIEITIRLMIDEYGAHEQTEIYSLFADNKVFGLDVVNQTSLKSIEDKNKTSNNHVKYEEVPSPYATNDVSSVYNLEPIFSGDMKVTGEAHYIVVQDMVNQKNGEAYLKLFGTTIDVPCLLHEANHAYAMMHPEYVYDGKKIISKHGMYTVTYEYKEDIDGKFIVQKKCGKDLILEDIICENITKKMLCAFFKKDDYKDVKSILNDIDHVGTEYNAILLTIGEKLESIIGSRELMNYRRNNDLLPIIKFNETVCKSDIALEYLDGKVPFDFLCEKIYELFILSVNKHHKSIGDYAYESAQLMLEAFAPLFAYDEVVNKTMSLDKYNKKRDDILTEYSQKRNNGLAS